MSRETPRQTTVGDPVASYKYTLRVGRGRWFTTRTKRCISSDGTAAVGTPRGAAADLDL